MSSELVIQFEKLVIHSMMEKLSEEEKFLLLGKVTGSLTPQEELELEQLFRNNSDARTAYNELAAELPFEDVATAFARRKQNPSWRDLTAQFRQQQPDIAAANIQWQGLERELAQQQTEPELQRIPFYRKNWVAAAGVVGILAGAGLLWYQSNKTTPSPITTATAQKPGIELKLADGKTINLTSQQGDITAGAAQLTNSNKTLTYATNNSSQAIGINSLTVPTGMDYKINLADGSEVWLNAATKLDFPLSFKGNTREITINGEAYLKIAQNASKPFIVHLPNSSVQVLGTEFNVNTYDPELIKVALVEGSVNLKAPTGDSKLIPGRQAVYQAGKIIEQQTFDAKYVLSWRRGLFFFNDATLTEISQVVPRWYGVKVALDDPSITTRHFTGVINRNRPIAVFLDDLKVIAKIDSWFDKDSTLHLK